MTNVEEGERGGSNHEVHNGRGRLPDTTNIANAIKGDRVRFVNQDYEVRGRENNGDPRWRDGRSNTPS